MKKRFSRVYLEITNICNKNCSFCPGTIRDRRMMSEDEFRRAAEALRPYTDYLYFHLMGEPLCHPELPKFIRIATDMGYRCAVTTNGSLLERRGAELLDSGVYKVNISVHSFEGCDESAHREYLRSCVDFADAASAKGILTVMRLWNKGHDGGKNDFVYRLLRESFPDGEWRIGERGARIRHKLHLEYGDRFDWPDMNAPLGDCRVFCYGLQDHMGVLCDGTAVPCCLDRDGLLSLGNIFESPLDHILASERAEAIRRGFEKRVAAEELCRRCGYARRFSV